MAENGNQAQAPDKEVDVGDAIAVDGELYRVDDLTAREQRELRRVLRVSTGHEEASLAALLNFGLVDDCDYYPAATYVIKRRTDPDVTPEQFEDMNSDAVIDETKKLLKKKSRGGRRPPQKPATSET